MTCPEPPFEQRETKAGSPIYDWPEESLLRNSNPNMHTAMYSYINQN